MVSFWIAWITQSYYNLQLEALFIKLTNSGVKSVLVFHKKFCNPHKTLANPDQWALQKGGTSYNPSTFLFLFLVNQKNLYKKASMHIVYPCIPTHPQQALSDCVCILTTQIPALTPCTGHPWLGLNWDNEFLTGQHITNSTCFNVCSLHYSCGVSSKFTDTIV